MPALVDAQKGFNDWRHLSPRIPEHENSPFHRENCIKWKILEQKIKSKTAIDASLQKAIDQETNKWRHILKVCTSVLLFCTENNLPLRGSHERIGESGSGVFLSAVDMIAKFDPELRAHIESLHKGNVSYFTPYIQNELVDILASEVKKQILDDVRAAKYFSILFDCTPDVSHKEQMSQILRFVKVSDQKVTIEERFIDFIQSHGKTGEGLSKEILEKLEVDGLNIQDLRGQGYDNGSNMAGKYNGVQAKIKQINENADYVPCAAHSLNLSGVHAASVTPDMITFFGIIQKIFVFFSSSTVRWETLMKHSNISLKKHADTRWASKARAVKALNSQLPQIWCVLKILTTNDYNAETISTAKNIMDQINYKFICTLQIWDKILESVDKVNVALQSKTMTIDKASELIKGLTSQIQNIRETVDIVFEKAKRICEQCDIEDNFPEKRRKRIKRHDLSESSDTGYDISQQQSFKIQINEAIDTIISELKWRFEKLRDIQNSFGFLTLKHITAYSVEELKKHAADLSIKYSADINATEFWSEIETLKNATCEKSFCMMWDESVAGRGRNEAASCLIKWVEENVSDEVREIAISSDNYPIRGHTHLEADAVHSTIERERKKLPQFQIMTPWDWQQMGRLCGIKKQFTVMDMECLDFKEFKYLFEGSTAPYINKKKNSEGNDFLISLAVHLQVRRSNPGILYYKTDFNKEFSEVDFHRRNKPDDYTPLGIALIRDGPKPISDKKCSHLQKVLQRVPRRFHDYYKNLEHGKNEDDE
nr:unnamed protein product [Callosobruchus analis]